jgi:hypothetical protein
MFVFLLNRELRQYYHVKKDKFYSVLHGTTGLGLHTQKKEEKRFRFTGK